MLLAAGACTTEPAELVLTPASFSFETIVGLPSSQTLTIGSTGDALGWSATDDATWLSLSITSATTPTLVVVTADPTGLGGGVHTATITIAEGSGTQRTAPVSFLVPAITGTWTGALTGFTMTASFSETGGAVTGSGTFTVLANPPGTMGATGVHTHPTVSLLLTFAGFQPVNFNGTFTSPTTIEGTFNGSGFVNEPFTLTRQ